jgi:glycerate-2-kinase
MNKIELNTTLPENPNLRKNIEYILNAAMDAADPYQQVQAAIHYSKKENLMRVAEREYEIRDGILLIAIGKAAQIMSKAALDTLGDAITSGICVTKAENAGIALPERIKLIHGGHPTPDDNSVLAARNIHDLVDSSSKNTNVLCLISGGGSALVCSPAGNISLPDLQEINRRMIVEDLSIDEINTVRKHIDLFKGGGLVRWLDGRSGVSLILSDVVSGELDTVASGPTVPDHTTYAEAVRLVKGVRSQTSIPESVMEWLQNGVSGINRETLKNEEFMRSGFVNVQIGSLRQSIQAAADVATLNGWQAEVKMPFIQGEMSKFASRLEDDLNCIYKTTGRTCYLYGGEGTIQVIGSGHGGRNSHLGLLMIETLARYPGALLVAFATDGEDGNSPGAGIICDHNSYTRAIQRGMQPGYYLGNSDSFTFFEQLGDAIITGSSGTNVNDLVILFYQ